MIPRVKETYLLNNVVRSRIQFGLLQRGSKRLHLCFVGNQLKFIILFVENTAATLSLNNCLKIFGISCLKCF